MRARLGFLSQAVLITLMLGLFIASQAEAEKCVDKPGPTPRANLKNPPELGSNSKRPTLTVKTDASEAADAGVTLPVKGGKRIGKADSAATASVTDKPSLKDRELDGDIALAAKPTATGNGVIVRACISGKGVWEADSYEGAIQVFGPRFNEVPYALVVTSKWHWVVPLVILAVVVIVFLFMEVRRKETGGPGNALYLAVAVGGALLTYFSQYADVDTWGDNPGIQVPGLAVAAITAAATGRAAAKKFFGNPLDPRSDTAAARTRPPG